MAYLRHGLVLLYQKACQKASIRARFSHNFLFREGLRLILGKPPESGSARLGHIPSLPWEPQLPLKPYLLLQPLNFKGNCDSLRFSPRFLLQFLMQFSFASQMWAARPHLGSIFEKLLHRKTFICLRLAPSSPIYIPLTKKSRTYRPALPHAAFALIRFFRTIQPANHLPASASDNLFQSLCS